MARVQRDRIMIGRDEARRVVDALKKEEQMGYVDRHTECHIEIMWWGAPRALSGVVLVYLMNQGPPWGSPGVPDGSWRVS